MPDIGKGLVGVGFDPGQVSGALQNLAGMIAPGFTNIASKLGISGGKTLGAGMALGIGAAAVGIGVALFKVGDTFDNLADTITTTTGKSGRALDGLLASAKRIGRDTPSSFAEIGVAVSGLNQRLGLTGRPLERLSRQVLNVSRLTGTDLKTNIEGITRLFGDWSIKTGQQGDTMDFLFRASQRTGIGFDRLSQLLVQFGSPLRALGFDMETAAVMFARFEKEGVNMETAMPGLRQALGNFAEAGKDPVKALNDVITAIRNTKSEGEAYVIANKIFGKRAGPDLARAIIEGRFSLEDLTKSIADGKNTIAGTDKQTRDFAESWQVFKNKTLITLEPIAVKVFDALSKGMAFISRNSGLMLPIIIGLTAAFAAMGVAILIATLPITAFGLAIAAIIGGVVAAVALVVANWDKIWGATKTVWGAITGAIAGAWRAITGVIIGAVRAVVGWIVQTWNKIWRTTRAIWSAILNFIKRLPGRIVGFFSGIGRWLARTIRSAWDRFYEATRQRVTAVINFVRGLPGRIARALGSLGRLLFEKGQDIIRGLLNGIRSIAHRVGRFLRDMAKSAVKSIGKFFGIGSPSKVFRDIGLDLGAGLVQGLAESERPVAAAAMSLGRAVDVPVSAAAGGRSAPAVVIQADNLDRALLEWLRRAVRTEGGNVQAVLGQR